MIKNNYKIKARNIMSDDQDRRDRKRRLDQSEEPRTPKRQKVVKCPDAPCRNPDTYGVEEKDAPKTRKNSRARRVLFPTRSKAVDGGSEDMFAYTEEFWRRKKDGDDDSNTFTFKLPCKCSV